MAFEKNNRYANLETYEVTDRRNRRVKVVPVPDPPGDELLGVHLMKQLQRLDHLAYKYLKDAEAFWRICEANNVMNPETLSEAEKIIIPQKGRR